MEIVCPITLASNLINLASSHVKIWSGFFGHGITSNDQNLREASTRFRRWARVNRHQYLDLGIIIREVLCFFAFSKLVISLHAPQTAESLQYVFGKSAFLRHSQGFFGVGLLHHDDGFPSLTCKAFNGRLFLVFLTACLKTLSDNLGNPDLEIRLALAACNAMCVFFDRMERSKRYLTPQEGDELYGAAVTFTQAVEKLATLNVRRKVQRFKLIPKHHVVLHLGEDQKRFLYNARFHHCYRDEDMVGLMKRLAVAVHKGPLMEMRILTRWLLRLSSWTPGTGS